MKSDKKSDANLFITCNFEKNNYENCICNNHNVAFCERK